VEIFGSWAPLILLFKKNRKSYLRVSKKYEKIPDVDHDLSHKHALYQFQILCIFCLHKNNKCVDLSMYNFKSSKLLGFCHFSVANNKKNFTLKICILVVTLMTMSAIYFYIFLKTCKYNFFIFFKTI
jgi:hypothetical protein